MRIQGISKKLTIIKQMNDSNLFSRKDAAKGLLMAVLTPVL
jgi:hypothetical protein